MDGAQHEYSWRKGLNTFEKVFNRRRLSRLIKSDEIRFYSYRCFYIINIDVFLTQSILPLKYFSSSAISSDLWTLPLLM